MPTYERTHCDKCYILLGKNEMHDITQEVSVLRSGYSVGVRQNGRRRGGLLWSWNSGRKYYVKKTKWLCDECYKQYEREQSIKYGLLLLLIIVFVCIAYFWSDNRPASSQPANQTASTGQDVQSSTSLSSIGAETPTVDRMQPALSDSMALSLQVLARSPVTATASPASTTAPPTANARALIAGSGTTIKPVPNQNGQIDAAGAKASQAQAESDFGPSIELRGEIQYPVEALRSGEEGVVVLDVAVGASGDVEKVTVVKSSGYRPLDNAAVKSVHGWHFSPGRQDSQPVSGDVRVPIKFSLSGMQ